MVHHSMLAGPPVHRCGEIPVCQSVLTKLFLQLLLHWLQKDTNIQRKNPTFNICAMCMFRAAINGFIDELINCWVCKTMENSEKCSLDLVLSIKQFKKKRFTMM